MDNETTKVTAEAANIVFDNASSISNAMMKSFNQGTGFGFKNGFYVGAVYGAGLATASVVAGALVTYNWPRIKYYVKSKFNKD